MTGAITKKEGGNKGEDFRRQISDIHKTAATSLILTDLLFWNGISRHTTNVWLYLKKGKTSQTLKTLHFTLQLKGNLSAIEWSSSSWTHSNTIAS